MTAPAQQTPGGEAGFTMIEMILALFVLSVGVLALFGGFDSARKLSLISERQATMAHVAQKTIEQIEGMAYKNIGLNATPATSTDPANPDYYVAAGTPPTFQWDRTASSSEPLDVDATNGQVAPTQSWSEGGLSGTIYQFVTWSTDTQCGSSCPSSQNYKRITVAVTVGSGLQPTPVWISSLIADPNATAQQGTPSNPLKDPSTTCTSSSGTTTSCTAPILQGTPNTYYLHDWPATSTSADVPNSSDHPTHLTAGIAAGKTCTTSTSSATTASNITGCPVPDLMDTNLPPGTTSSTLYHFSSDLGTSGYPGGRLLQQTCSSTTTPCGTDSTADCSANTAYSTSLQAGQTEFLVTPPLSSAMTLNGQGALSIYTQTQNAGAENVSFCLEVYDVPPSGTAGSLSDLYAWPPKTIGGVAYVPATDPTTAGNWPTGLGQLNFTFTYTTTTYSIPSGDRIGVRLWMLSSTTNPIAIVYDHASYPSQVQLNSQ